MMPAPEKRNVFSWLIGGGRKHHGFTLVELMIAMTIGLIILAAVAQIFATSRGTYGLQEGMARVQEGGRFGIEFLSVDIRMAGYAGCNSNLTLGTPDASGNCKTGEVCNIASGATAPEIFNPDGMQGHVYAGTGTAFLSDWDPDLPGGYFSDNEVMPRTDVIIIQRASTTGANLTGNTTPDNAQVHILDTADIGNQISQNDIVMLSDCKGGDIFRVTNNPTPSGGIINMAHASSGNTPNPPFLTHSYGNDAELFKLVSRAYYISKRDADGDGNPDLTDATLEPALFRKELVTGGTTAQELIEGVEEMRILYGEDTDADKVTNIYRTASNVSDWSNIVSVRVGLLVRTPTNVDTGLDIKTYPIAGVSVGPFNDKRRRHAFTTTIQRRN